MCILIIFSFASIFSDEMFLTAIEKLFSESTNSLKEPLKIHLKNSQSKILHKTRNGKYCSFSDYEMNERIKVGSLRKKKRKKEIDIMKKKEKIKKYI